MHHFVAGIWLLAVGQVTEQVANTKPVDERLRGTWVVKSGILGGEPIKLAERAKYVFVFDDDRVLTRLTGEPDRVGKCRCGMAKSIDVDLIGDDFGRTLSMRGIYQIEGEGLHIAIPSGKATARPEKFFPAEGVDLLYLERLELPKGEEIKVPSAPERADGKAQQLDGRWTFVADGKADKTMEIEFIGSFFSKQYDFVIRRKSRPTFFGSSIDVTSTVTIPCLIEPDGRKNVIGVAEKVDETKKEQKLHPIRFCFRGDLLELRGMVTPDVPPIGALDTINLTGQWRAAEKTAKK